MGLQDRHERCVYPPGILRQQVGQAFMGAPDTIWSKSIFKA
jgi:hypothetical protein